MRVQSGKETEYIGSRLRDIVYLAEKTKPVDDDWKGYAEEVLVLIVRQAAEAQTALAALALTNGARDAG